MGIWLILSQSSSIAITNANKHTHAHTRRGRMAERECERKTTTMNLDRYLLVSVINKALCRIGFRYEINMANWKSNDNINLRLLPSPPFPALWCVLFPNSRIEQVFIGFHSSRNIKSKSKNPNIFRNSLCERIILYK